jgi:hypothetical protein
MMNKAEVCSNAYQKIKHLSRLSFFGTAFYEELQSCLLEAPVSFRAPFADPKGANLCFFWFEKKTTVFGQRKNSAIQCLLAAPY